MRIEPERKKDQKIVCRCKIVILAGSMPNNRKEIKLEIEGPIIHRVLSALLWLLIIDKFVVEKQKIITPHNTTQIPKKNKYVPLIWYLNNFAEEKFVFSGLAISFYIFTTYYYLFLSSWIYILFSMERRFLGIYSFNISSKSLHIHTRKKPVFFSSSFKTTFICLP